MTNEENQDRRAHDRREEIRGIQKDYNNTNLRVGLLEQTVKQHNEHINKLDENTNAIKDLTTTMFNMVKNHDEHIKTADKLIESRRIEREHEVKELHTRITHSEKEILSRVDEKVKSAPVGDALLDRIRKLENWKWMLLGGGVVIGFVITKLPALLKILNSSPIP